MPIDRLVMAIYGPFALEVRQTVARSALGKSTILLVQTATYSYRKKIAHAAEEPTGCSCTCMGRVVWFTV